MQKVYLICGVPASGKTWVCNQLTDKFEYIPNDDHIKTKNYAPTIAKRAKGGDKPILADCPFAERVLKDRLKELGVEVIIPVFVIETPEVIKRRYFQRNKKPASQSTLTHAVTILDRAKEWGGYYGTSDEVLKYLKSIA